MSGSNIRFHHNWVDNMQDDGIYLSSPTPYFNETVRAYQNLITRVFSAFSCHSYGGPQGDTYVYRNVVDLRQGVRFDRPSPQHPEGQVMAGHVFLVHGGDLLGIESIAFYQNTFVTPALSGGYAGRTWVNTSARTARRSFNNLFVYLNGYPAPEIAYAPEHNLQTTATSTGRRRPAPGRRMASWKRSEPVRPP